MVHEKHESHERKIERIVPFRIFVLFVTFMDNPNQGFLPASFNSSRHCA